MSPTKETIYLRVQILLKKELLTMSASIFYLNLLWNHMITERQLFNAMYSSDWSDINHPAKITTAETMLART